MDGGCTPAGPEGLCAGFCFPLFMGWARAREYELLALPAHPGPCSPLSCPHTHSRTTAHLALSSLPS